MKFAISVDSLGELLQLSATDVVIRVLNRAGYLINRRPELYQISPGLSVSKLIVLHQTYLQMKTRFTFHIVIQRPPLSRTLFGETSDGR